MSNKSWVISVVVVLLFIGVYYATHVNSTSEQTKSVIKIGVLPDENHAALKKRYVLLIEYLIQNTGLNFELVIPKNYFELLKLFGEEKLDLSYFGGFTFLRAEEQYGAVPLVMRDVDTRFTSWFIVKTDNKAQSISDFKGKSFAFGSNLSTSGHLMPRYFMGEHFKISPEDFFADIQFSGAHDKTTYLVRDGKVDLGVVNSEIVRKMLKDGRVKETEIRVLWETPPFPDYVWTIQANLSIQLRRQIRDAFLSLDVNNVKHKAILSAMGTDLFLPAGSHDFNGLKDTAIKLKLLN